MLDVFSKMHSAEAGYLPLEGKPRIGQRRQRLHRALASCVLTCTLVVFYIASSRRLSGSPWYGQHRSDHEQKIFNSTLDFGKIYAISLPDHFSKRDELFLIEKAFGLQFTHIDGVLGSSIPREQLPYIVNKNMTSAQFGCWRSHVNVWRKMIEDNIDTALILEEDVNFDVMLRSQLASFRSALNDLQDVRASREEKSAWPGAWDLLWLGTCYERKSEGAGGEDWTLYEDDTVPERDRMLQPFKALLPGYGLPDSPSGFDGRRVIQKSVYPLCTVGYAIRRSAALHLYYETTRYLQEPIDNYLASRYDINAFSVIPPLFMQWKTKGARNSYIQEENVLEQFFDPSLGDSHNIRVGASIRHHLKDMLRPRDPYED